jgi:hypothetical protein
MRRDQPRPQAISSLIRGTVAQQQVRNGVALRIAQDEQITDLASLDYNGNENKALAVNPSGSGLDLVDAPPGSEPVVVAGTASQYWRGDKTWQTLDKAAVGLSNVNNTSDANKPVSLAQEAALNLKVSRSACMVRKAANETADYSVSTAVPWDQEVYDDNSFHSNTTNNTRLTVPSGVTRVRVGGSLRITGVTASTDVIMTLLKGGVSQFEGAAGARVVTSAAASSPQLTISTGPVPVSAGDYFEILLQTVGDTSVTIDAARSNFWVEVY